MTAEGRFAPTLDNLTEDALSIARLQEKRAGYLSELAEALLASVREAGGDTPRALLSAIAALLPACEQPPPCDPAMPARHARLWQGALSAMDALDRAWLSLAVRRQLERQLGRPLSLAEVGDGVLPLPERERVVYVKNPLADAAYERLSPLLGAPTVGNRQSFRELFDDVENHYADYAILPLFSDGVAVQSVASLFYDYGLKLCAASAVPTEEGEILFGLVGRGALLHRPPEYFTFHILPEREGAPIALLAAAAPLGTQIIRLDPVPLTYDTSRVGYRVIAAAEDPDAFVSLSVYLSLYAPGYTGYGFYACL